MANRTLKAGDTDPPFTSTLTDGNGQPVNLTGAETVTLFMVPKDGGIGSVSDPCTIVNPAGGIVEYRPTKQQTSVPGTYRLEWRVDWGPQAGKDRYRTFPSDGYEEVEIMESLAP